MDPFTIPTEQAGETLAAVLRTLLPGQSWKQVRQVVAGRRVKINGELWLDPARRLKPGDTVEMLGRPEKLPEAFTEDLVVRYLDGH
ncbi:MAG TPA: S4 domain-containing protein, partial [Gemmataceae bacterium]|nr:S4 domain-containing protein [Gemmataceae bacterium]